MRITRAQSTDGRVFRAVGDGYRLTYDPALRAAALPPSPVHRVTPSSAVTPPLARVLRPQAAYRWLLPQLASITPQYIEMVLRSALTGDHVQQWELFDLMFDTWPELASCAQELTYGVTRQKLIFEPYAEEGEDPSPEAVERCKLVSAALRRMSPDAAADENDLDGTLQDLIDGWFRGVTALEIDWQPVTSARRGTMLAPRSTFWVHPVCFAFDVNGRLGLRLNAQGRVASGMPAQSSQTTVSPFPAHKFLIGIHKAKSGTALGGALLRPLAWWWCAANFSADWLLNLAQIFGLPFRWANYEPTAPQETVDRICSMLQNMGSAGWAAFPQGTTLEMKDTGKTGDHSPQGELLDRADRYARLLILGQTMSGGQDASKGGGKAFGEVEGGVKAQRIDAAARYVCRILNTQLIPSILAVNYGETDEAPRARLLVDEKGSTEEAQRDLALAQGGLEIAKSFLRKKYGLPAPAEGEETVGGGTKRQVDDTHGNEQDRSEDESALRNRSDVTWEEADDDSHLFDEETIFNPGEKAAYDEDEGTGDDDDLGGEEADEPDLEDAQEEFDESSDLEAADEREWECGDEDGDNEALEAASERYDNVKEWRSTRTGGHFPVREGQTTGEALAEHLEWLKTAMPGQKRQRFNRGQKESLKKRKAERRQASQIKDQQKGAERLNPATETSKIEPDHDHSKETSTGRHGAPENSQAASQKSPSEKQTAEVGQLPGGRPGRRVGLLRTGQVPAHPHSGSAGAGGQGKSQGRTGGHAGRSPRHGTGAFAGPHGAVFRKLAAAEQAILAAGRSALTDVYGAGRRVLEGLRKSGTLATIRHQVENHLAEGGEHYIELTTDGKRVLKHTKNGLFGFISDLDEHGHINLRRATSSEYMLRMEEHNHLFGTDLTLEGSHERDGGGLTYSQTHHHGDTPEERQIIHFMGDHGFMKVDSDHVMDRSTEHTTWFHPKSGHVVADTKPENFRLGRGGKVRPLDLLVRKVEPGTPLFRALLKGIGHHH